MRRGRSAKSALPVFVLAGLVAIGIVSAKPAQAGVVVGFGFGIGPFWGFPIAVPIPYLYPFPYAFPYLAPPPYFAPSAAYAPTAGPGYGARPSTWYYCDSPRGYYPYVPHCNSGWHAVPATSAPQQ